MPRLEHKVGRFLSIFEERLARRANQRTHGKATTKIRDLNGAFGHRKIGRDFARADRVTETTFHQRRAARGGFLQELPDFSICLPARRNPTRRSPR
jgi:hypothetical protein